MKRFISFFWCRILFVTPLLIIGCYRKSEGVEGKRGSLNSAVLQQIGPEFSNVNHEVTGAMHRYLEKKGALPTRVEQLVTEGYLKKLPSLPPGKIFFINTNNLQVEMIDPAEAH